MQYSIQTLAILGLTAFTSLTSAQAVAFGQQLQNNDQTNHWVAWTEGEHACPGMQVLSKLTDTPCGHGFSLGEVRYQFSGCPDEAGTPPTVLLDSGGLQIGGCKPASDKINCHDGLHDIVKWGVCEIVN